MTTILKPARPPVAGRLVERGVPFSTRMDCGVKVGLSPVTLGNRAFIRAWTIRRAMLVSAPVRHAK